MGPTVALVTLKESLLPSRESNHDFLLSHPLHSQFTDYGSRQVL